MKAIEKEAFSKGWTQDQLWLVPDYPIYDQMGLICFVDGQTTISEVTERYIALTHESPTGGPITNNFYNMKVEQHWIKKGGQK